MRGEDGAGGKPEIGFGLRCFRFSHAFCRISAPNASQKTGRAPDATAWFYKAWSQKASQKMGRVLGSSSEHDVNQKAASCWRGN